MVGLCVICIWLHIFIKKEAQSCNNRLNSKQTTVEDKKPRLLAQAISEMEPLHLCQSVIWLATVCVAPASETWEPWKNKLLKFLVAGWLTGRQVRSDIFCHRHRRKRLNRPTPVRSPPPPLCQHSCAKINLLRYTLASWFRVLLRFLVAFFLNESFSLASYLPSCQLPTINDTIKNSFKAR